MSGRRGPTPPDEVYRSFVRELARCPEAAEMLGRMRDGHEADEHGWCSHPAHTHHWEQHPCFTRRLADLVDGVGGQDP